MALGAFHLIVQITLVGQGFKVMVVVDGNGVSLGLPGDSAQLHEITLAQRTLDSLRVPQRQERPKSRPKEPVADRAYDSWGFRKELRKWGIKPVIPTFERRKRVKPKRGRPIKVGAGYGQRWIVERCFAWMDNCRRLVVRYDWDVAYAFLLAGHHSMVHRSHYEITSSHVEKHRRLKCQRSGLSSQERSVWRLRSGV